MLFKILLVAFYAFVTVMLYKLILTRLEKFELYQKIHEYHKQTMGLFNPRCYIEYFKNKYSSDKKNKK